MIKRNPSLRKSLLASLDVFYKRWWWASKDVGWLILAPSYFFLQNSPLTRLSNIDLVDNLLICWFRPHNCKLPKLYNFCFFYYCFWISVRMSFSLFANYLYYVTLAVTRRKYCGFSTFLKVWFYKPFYPPDITSKKVPKSLPWFFNSA